MDDIAPKLLEKLQEDFKKSFAENKKIKALYKKAKNGKANYKEAQEFAIEVGEVLKTTFKKNLSSSLLPNGRMYYNIADRVIRPMLKNNYDVVTDVSTKVQTALNKSAGIGIKAIKPKMNTDRVKGIINIVSGKENYDDISYMLGDTIVNFSQSIVDDTVRENADFQYNAGLSPKIIRTSTGKCCEWCAEVAGVYEYEQVKNTGNNVFRRHKNCRCLVEYDPGNGAKTQNIWTKKWNSKSQLDSAREKQYNIIKEEKKKERSELRKLLQRDNVEYKKVEKLKKELSDQEIISRIGGGDMTKGSCSSLAFAYIGNKNGLNVLDFRGGISLESFASDSYIQRMLELPGVKGSVTKVKKGISGTVNIIESLEYGKEYYLATGKHAAIIRKTEKGAEYLELQSATANGWTSFEKYGSMNETLYERFGCRDKVKRIKLSRKTITVERSVVLMEVDSFKDNTEFENILGYINTAIDKQKKGVSGSVR